MLTTMLEGFDATAVTSIIDVENHLRSFGPLHRPLDFIVLDSQFETDAEQLARSLPSMNPTAFRETKILHLYTPTTNLHSVFGNSIPGVIKMTKPPRKARLLQALANLKELPNTVKAHVSDVTQAMEDLAAAQRTLFGNVLVAEGNC